MLIKKAVSGNSVYNILEEEKINVWKPLRMLILWSTWEKHMRLFK